ncbi:hypothetical protein PV10_04726 [Exophiala mesophila]|uniref:Major facilitator superfamily (MFS) profile domain-containing protein n=1 Tax=Exophiala mesophila TaxID=212818 RepID=A0A0D1WVZ8_EXOME|nr:uncharacterized protein PV10_04726 [Exophiala mesophila]KIV93515.1 hypothetical protein PV10_04726 [Exophiala mesophila]
MAKLTSYNIAIALVVTLGGFSFGFGSSSFITSIGQPGFYLYFNLDPASSHTASIITAINALYCFGAAVGSIGQSWFADKWGRKKALLLAGVIALVGNALVAGSVAIGMMIACRIIQGCGLGALLALVPIYLAEVAPPRSRGLLTGLTVLSFGFGFVACAWIAVGCYHAKNLTLSWRLPLSLSCVPQLFLLPGLLFVPESPRFLIWRNELDEAWRILKRLHHDPECSTDEDARTEFTQIVRQVDVENEEKATFIQMFKKPSWRRRSLLVLFLLFAVQSTGVNGVTNYLPVIFASLGLDTGMSLILYAVHTTCGTIFVALSLLVVDKFGRRTLFIIGFASLACIGLGEALLQWKYVGTDDKAGNAACVLFIFLFIAFYQCVDAPSVIWAAEIFPTSLRAKGVSLAVFAFFAGTITFGVPAAVAFQSIGWRMYLIYAGLSVVSLVLTIFYIPETKLIPMEEIGALFGDHVVTHMTANGQALVEEEKAGETHLEMAKPAAS